MTLSKERQLRKISDQELICEIVLRGFNVT